MLLSEAPVRLSGRTPCWEGRDHGSVCARKSGVIYGGVSVRGGGGSVALSSFVACFVAGEVRRGERKRAKYVVEKNLPLGKVA